MKKIYKLLICLFMCLCFSGCSKEVSDSSGEISASLKLASSSNDVVIDTERKVTYNVSYTFNNVDIKEASDDIYSKVKEYNGYLESGDFYDESGYAYCTYKVPTTSLNAFLDYVESRDGVGSKSVSMEDITSSYSYTEAKIQTLTASKEAYEDLLADGGLSMADIISINKELDEINTELASLNNQKAIYDSELEYSEIYIRYYCDNTDEDDSFIIEYLKNIAEFFVGLGVAIMYIIPIGGTLGGITILVIFVIKKVKKHFKNKKVKGE